MTAMRALTVEQVDELIEQSDRLLAIYDLVLGNDLPGSLMTIDRNNFARLLDPIVLAVSRLASSTQPIDLQPSLQ
jgi:hypothetical protein